MMMTPVEEEALRKLMVATIGDSTTASSEANQDSLHQTSPAVHWREKLTYTELSAGSFVLEGKDAATNDTSAGTAAGYQSPSCYLPPLDSEAETQAPRTNSDGIPVVSQPTSAGPSWTSSASLDEQDAPSLTTTTVTTPSSAFQQLPQQDVKHHHTSGQNHLSTQAGHDIVGRSSSTASPSSGAVANPQRYPQLGSEGGGRAPQQRARMVSCFEPAQQVMLTRTYHPHDEHQGGERTSSVSWTMATRSLCRAAGPSRTRSS